MLGIVGESGSEKSMTASSILRLLPKNTGKVVDGEILFEGRDVLKFNKSELLDYRGKDVVLIFQDPMTFESYPYELSGGMSQRIIIAMAISAQPKLVIADEPTTALDVSVQAQVLNLLNKLQKQHDLTMVFISHDLSVIKHVSDRIVIMYLGRVVELCSAEEIYTYAKHPYTKALLSAIPPESPFVKNQQIQLTGEIPSSIGEQIGCPFARGPPLCHGTVQKSKSRA